MGVKGSGASRRGAGRKGEWPMWREEHEQEGNSHGEAIS